MRTNDKKTRGEKDPNEYYDSPGFPPRTGDQSQPGIQNQLGVQSAKPDAKAAPDTEALCTSNDAITPSNADPGAKAAPDTEAICSSSETRTSSNADPGARPSADPEDPDAYNVFEDLIWSQDDEEIDFPPPIPITLETPPPYVSESVGAESNGAAGVPPAMLPALDSKAKSPGHTGTCDAPYSTPRDGAAGVPPAKTNGAAGVPPAMLPALDRKAQSPGHTGTCDAPYSTPLDGAAGVPPAKTNGAAGVPPAKTNGAAGVPPAILPALNGKEQSPGHTGTCDAPSQNPLCVSPSPRLWVENNATSPDDFEKASQIVQKLAQCVIPYSDWYRIGLALYAGFGEAGRQLWNLFLANPHYNDSQRDLDAKWNSFRNPREITLATLFEIGGRHGCR